MKTVVNRDSGMQEPKHGEGNVEIILVVCSPCQGEQGEEDTE